MAKKITQAEIDVAREEFECRGGQMRKLASEVKIQHKQNSRYHHQDVGLTQFTSVEAAWHSGTALADKKMSKFGKTFGSKAIRKKAMKIKAINKEKRKTNNLVTL